MQRLIPLCLGVLIATTCGGCCCIKSYGKCMWNRVFDDDACGFAASPEYSPYYSEYEAVPYEYETGVVAPESGYDSYGVVGTEGCRACGDHAHTPMQPTPTVPMAPSEPNGSWEPARPYEEKPEPAPPSGGDNGESDKTTSVPPASFYAPTPRRQYRSSTLQPATGTRWAPRR